jgi:drug/metabolite transporter (DMT)-like permease
MIFRRLKAVLSEDARCMSYLHECPKNISPRKASTLALLTAALIWGGTFVIVKVSVQTIPPFSFVFGRFAIAFVLLTAFSWREMKTNWRVHFPPSLFLGVLLFVGFTLQVWGLQRTSASGAGFITGLCVALVAALDILVNRRRPTLLNLLGLISAVAGLVALSLGQSKLVSLGNLLVLGCAVAFGLHVFYTDRFSKRFDVKVLTAEQIGVVAIVAFGGASLNGELNFMPSHYAIFGLLYTGVLATALAYFLQTWGQKHAHATYSAIVLAAEPVFAATFAVALLAESPKIQLITAGILVTIGMILASLRRQKPQTNVDSAKSGEPYSVSCSAKNMF